MASYGTTIFHQRLDINKPDHGYICADCGHSEVEWVSMNLGVLLCSRCCHSHRCLGRHISYIAHIAYSPNLNFNLLKYICCILEAGSQEIWENDESKANICVELKKKRSNKAMFIYKKYVDKEFHSSHGVNCQNYDGFFEAVKKQQLLEVFRYLVGGSDPNFEWLNGDCAIHIALKNGDVDMIQLLAYWGASLQSVDSSGESVIEIAQKVNVAVLSAVQYLIYEITDSFSLYLFNIQPDHRKDCHYFLGDPDKVSKAVPSHVSEIVIFMKELDIIAAEIFIQDIFDEIHRRCLNFCIFVAFYFITADVVVEKLFYSEFSNKMFVTCLTEHLEYSVERNSFRAMLSLIDEANFSFLVYSLLFKVIEEDRKYKSPTKGIIEAQYTGDKNEMAVNLMVWRGFRVAKKAFSKSNDTTASLSDVVERPRTNKGNKKSTMSSDEVPISSENWFGRFTSCVSKVTGNIKLIKRSLDTKSLDCLDSLAADLLSSCLKLTKVAKEKVELQESAKKLIKSIKAIDKAVDRDDLKSTDEDEYISNLLETIKKLAAALNHLTRLNQEIECGPSTNVS